MNKNLIIKIGVPFVVLIGIIVLIATNQKSVETLKSEMEIKPLDFKHFIDQYITDSISGQSTQKAKEEYEQLYEIINTEAAIDATTPSGKDKLLSQEEADELYKRAFSAYYDIFSQGANTLFNSSNWDDTELKRIKKETQELSDRKGASHKQELNNYAGYVDGYYAAVSLLANSKRCGSRGSYQKYCQSAQSYSAAPYSNNTKLKGIETTVSQNASNGWQASIQHDVRAICNKTDSTFYSYQQFENEQKRIFDRINEYNSTLQTKWGNNLKDQLNDKSNKVLTYFNSKNNY